MTQESNTFHLAVIIINYRTPEYTKSCLATLLPQLDEIDATVIVVDNNSQDGSLAEIRDWLNVNDVKSKTTLIQSNKNGGFAAGNNVGIKACNADYYLLLNSDTLLREGSIKILLDTAEQNDGFGLVSPRLEWPDEEGQESCFNFPGLFSEFMQSAQTGIIDKLLLRYVIANPVQTGLFYPNWTSFACVLIREEVFQQIGLLDEGYFMYFEDIEFCLRAKKAGWNVIHNPDSKVVHLRGGSSPVKSLAHQQKRLPSYYYESRTRFFFQANGMSGLVLSNIMWLLGRVISKARQLLGRADKGANERQWLDIWRNCTRPLSPFTHPDS